METEEAIVWQVFLPPVFFPFFSFFVESGSIHESFVRGTVCFVPLSVRQSLLNFISYSELKEFVVSLTL